MKPKHQRVHEKRLRRKAKQAIKRHQTFVESKGPIEVRLAKNAIKHPSLAGLDKRPNKPLKPKSKALSEPKSPVVEQIATEQGIPVINETLSQ